MSGIQYGMPTLVELPDVAANVSLCRRLGLGFIELNIDLPACQPESLPAERLRRWRDEDGIDFTVHLPERLDLGAFQSDIRQGHVACAKHIIGWAGEAGIRKLTMHMNPGVYFTLPTERVWLYRRHRDTYMANLLAAVGEIQPVLAAHNAMLLIENTGIFGQDFIAEATEQLLARYSKHVGLTWDVGHDAESGYKNSPFNTRHLDRVAHMHLHDFDGKNAHQPLFTGAVDIPAFLKVARKRQASVVIETKTIEALTSSVTTLSKHGVT